LRTRSRNGLGHRTASEGGGWAGADPASAAYKYGNEGRIIAFRLDGGPVPLRPLLPPPDPLPQPPQQHASAAQIARGATLFAANCGICHPNMPRSGSADLRGNLYFAAAAVHSAVLDRLLSPLVVVSQTIPVIALAPLLVLWFGYGVLPRVLVCALIAFFPMAVTALQGFRTVDGQLLLLMRSVNASRWDVFWRVRFPGAAPFLTAGLRTGATLSLVGAVVAEWTGSDRGLGYLVLSANSRLATGQAFAAVLLISILGLAAYGGSLAVESRFSWWRHNPSSDQRKGS
jgi:ABC-type proline/glycine betaine transport system permease subunit